MSLARIHLKAAIAVAAFGVIHASEAFTIPDHVSMTWDALGEYVYVTSGGKRIQFERFPKVDISLGNSETDLDQTAAKHCDDEQVAACKARVDTLRREIVDLLVVDPFTGLSDPYQARLRLGTALHTIQDFYAHSTWVESQKIIAKPSLDIGKDGVLLGTPPVCSGGKELEGKKFTTGYYVDPFIPLGRIDLPALQPFIDARYCLHGQIANDLSETPGLPPPPRPVTVPGIAKDLKGPLHDTAKRFARTASKEFLDEVRNLLPPDKRDAAMCALMGYDEAADECGLVPPTLLGATLFFNRRYPTMDTPYAWAPPTVSTVVTAGPADTIAWRDARGFLYALVDPESQTISFTLPTPSEYIGTADVFDGFVVTGFPADIASATAESIYGIGIIGLGTRGPRELYINLDGDYPPSSRFTIRVKLK